MFITFEGIDGCGKTTQACRIADYLKSRLGEGAVLLTQEPGGWPQGEKIREMLLTGHLEHVLSELFLFLIDRCEHLSQVVLPALKEGRVVLCDRYTDSTLAYQAWGRGLPRAQIEALFDWCAFPRPDLTFWFALSPAVAAERLKRRGGTDRIESADDVFLDRVVAGYEALWREDSARIRRIDASRDEEHLFASLRLIVTETVETR
ncbi:MAG: dTMP kinase [Synergistales bacterium]|nr:dTMP kinase [Synergistales bacterium]